MIVLHLGCRNYGIGLEFPTTYDEAAKRISALREGLGRPAPVQITAVSGPIPNLYSYIQHTGLESESDIRKLNALAEKIDRMTQPEQQIFSGALELEAAGGLDNALSIADSLAQYEMFPQVTTDEELGRFLVDTAPEFSFPKEVHPYLDYAKIGLEQHNVLGGAHTQYGYIRCWERAASLEEAEKSVIRVALSTPDNGVCLGLPCSEEQLAQAKRVLGVRDFTEAHLSKLEYATPSLESLIPLDDFTVEDANELAQYLHQMGKSNELWKFCAVLEVEEPDSFSAVLNLAEDLDDYEAVLDNERQYAMDILRRCGADDELLKTIDGYTDFDQLGRDQMEEDGVRQTSFGLVRRLSTPFPPEQELEQTMG